MEKKEVEIDTVASPANIVHTFNIIDNDNNSIFSGINNTLFQYVTYQDMVSSFFLPIRQLPFYRQYLLIQIPPELKFHCLTKCEGSFEFCKEDFLQLLAI